MAATTAATFRVLVLAFGLAGCSELPQQNDGQGDPAASLVEQVQAVAGSWRITSETDALTDRRVASAARYIIAADSDFMVRVTCSDSGALRYSFTSFDKEGGPAEMQSKFYPSTTYVRGGVFVPYFLRLDSATPQRILGTAPHYNNEVEFGSNPEGVLPGKIDAYAVASANRIVARFQLMMGEETVQFSQSDANFQGVVQPCLDARRDFIGSRQRRQPETSEDHSESSNDSSSEESEAANLGGPDDNGNAEEGDQTPAAELR